MLVTLGGLRVKNLVLMMNCVAKIERSHCHILSTDLCILVNH